MQWICRRLVLITFNYPYLLPHCGFSFTASQFGKSYVRKKVMCGPHTSRRFSLFYRPAHQVPWEDRKPYTKKTPPYVCLYFNQRLFLSILTVDFPLLLRSLVNLTFRRRWCVGPIRRLILITFRLPYLLPHCWFSFTASQFGKSYVRKKVMQWICRRFTPPSSTALLFPRRLID